MTSVHGRRLHAYRLKDCGPLWRRSAFRSLMERLAQFRFAGNISRGRPRRMGGPEKNLRIRQRSAARWRTGDGPPARKRVKARMPTINQLIAQPRERSE